MGVSKNSGTPTPIFLETPIYIYIYIKLFVGILIRHTIEDDSRSLLRTSPVSVAVAMFEPKVGCMELMLHASYVL